MAFVDEFTPKLFSLIRDGYGKADLRADMLAGLTVAIVALPLSMAIAIASGVGPERGLYTAIVGGFLVSVLGGSRYQIGGPAGAFIVLVSACMMQLGIEGLILATFLSGFILMAVGALRLGTYIKFIPYPVTVGFTAGIAVIIFASQIRDLFGLSLGGPEPSEIVEKVETLWAARATVTPWAVGIALGTMAVILGLKRWLPHWPGMLIAITLAGAAAWAFSLPVETIGSTFGALPRTLPMPALPVLEPGLVLAALPFAASFALLGSIESLLSAVVADGMSGDRHLSNAELVAQGAANIGSAVFGGFCVTGTIARTATNVRAGSRGPVSGVLHAVFLLMFLWLAAPLAAWIPLSALAGVLVIVSWNMAERPAIIALLRSSRADAVIVLITFLLVVFRDLTEGIVAGAAIGGAVFIRRMSEAVSVRDEPVETPLAEQAEDVLVYRLRGAWFFGAVATAGAVLDRIADRPGVFIIDFRDVPFIDSSGAHSFEILAHKLARKGGRLILTGASPEVRRVLLRHGLRGPGIRWRSSVEAALKEFAPPATA